MAQNVQEVACDICDEIDEVNSFCVNCKQNLCDGCKKGHLRTAATKHHKFLLIGDSLVASYRVSDICSEHKEQKQFYCKTCSKTACSECLAKYHQRHDFSMVNRFAASIGQDITNKLSEKEREINTLSQTIQKYPSEMESLKSDSRQAKAAIMNSIKGWIDELKSIEEKLLQNVDSATTEGIVRLEKVSRELESNNIKNLQSVFDIQAKLRTCSDVALIEQSSEIIAQINEIQVLSSSLEKSKLPAVSLRSSNVNDLKKMLGFSDNRTHLVASSGQQKGQLQRSDGDEGTQNKGACNRKVGEDKPMLRDKLSIIKKLQFTLNNIYDIATLSDSKAWVAATYSIMLVWDTGKVLVCSEAMRQRGTCVAAMPNGDALYASSDTVISRIDQRGKVTVFFVIKPNFINDIATSKREDIVYVATKDTVLKLSHSAQVVDRIHQGALALTELSNGDIIIVTVNGDMVMHHPNKANSVLLSRLEGVRCDRFSTPLTSDKHHGRIISANPNGKDVYVFDIENDKADLRRTYSADMGLVFAVGILLLRLPVKCHPQQLSVLGTANTAKSLKLCTIKNKLNSRVLFV